LLPLLIAGGIIWKLNQLGPQWFYPSNPGENGNRPELYFLGTFLLLMIGLLTAGAFLTYLVAKLLGKIARGASSVMATKRLQMFARPIFSSVSGVVLALFVGSFFLGTIASVEATLQQEFQSAQASHDLQGQKINTNQLKIYEERSGEGRFYQLFQQHSQLMSLVKRHTQIQRYYSIAEEKNAKSTDEQSVFGEIYTCQELAQWTKLRCPTDYQPTDRVLVEEKHNQLVRVTPDLLAKGKIYQSDIVLQFDNRADLERGRKFVQNIIAQSIRQYGYGALIQSDDDALDVLSSVHGLVQAVMAGTALTIGVAGFSVAVAMIGSFFERKKSFSNLRLMGIDIAQLYRVVLIESILPLLLSTILAVTIGLLTVRYLVSVMSQKFVFAMPKMDYFWLVTISLVVTIGIVISTLPILKRVTELESNRTE
jgi:putative ABC transport system permease protein